MNQERTLYLNEKKGLTVRRDGPSLWIRERNSAGRRIPARFIDMVYIIGNIKMDAGVVTLFVEHNVPVSFMNSKGETLGVVMPYNYTLLNYSEDQKKLLKSEEYIERFRLWTLSMRREIQLFILRKVAFAKTTTFMSEGFKEYDYKEIIRSFMYRKEKEWEVVHQVNKNIFMEMIIKHLVDAKLDPHMGVLERRKNFGFALDFYNILSPEIDRLTIDFFTSLRWHDFILKTQKHCI